jgi:hypothetical protein
VERIDEIAGVSRSCLADAGFVPASARVGAGDAALGPQILPANASHRSDPRGRYPADGVSVSRRKEIADRAISHKLPTIFALRPNVDAGAFCYTPLD